MIEKGGRGRDHDPRAPGCQAFSESGCVLVNVRTCTSQAENDSWRKMRNDTLFGWLPRWRWNGIGRTKCQLQVGHAGLRTQASDQIERQGGAGRHGRIRTDCANKLPPASSNLASGAHCRPIATSRGPILYIETWLPETHNVGKMRAALRSST